MDADAPVVAEKLSFWYGPVLALSDVDLKIEPGITAVLGPNGSGKTTLFRTLGGFLRPRTGSVRIFSESPWNNPRTARRVGIAPETDTLDVTTTGRGFVRFALSLKGVFGEKAPTLTERALERVDAKSFADRPIRTLSRGMRQRIKLAAAIAHEPELLILDEPLTGVDPVMRTGLKRLFRELGDEGRTLLVSSHVLSEIEQLTSRIVLLHRGRLLAEGDVKEIRSLIDRHPHTVRVRSSRARELASSLVGSDELVQVSFEEEVASFLTRKPGAFYRRLTKEIASRRVPIEELTCPDDNLEAVFRYLTRP